MSEANVGIGAIKYLAKDKKRGVIAPRKVRGAEESGDLYFVVSAEQASRLRQGQLVQFIVEDDEAKDVKVLSDSA